MRGIKLNIHKLSIPILSIHKINNCNNNTLNKGVEIFKVIGKEEDLVIEEAKSYVTIMDNQNIFIGTVQTLQRHVRIVNPLIILSDSVCN